MRDSPARLIDLCDADRGITYGIVKVGDFVPGGVPVIRGGDIRDGRVLFDDDKRVSHEVSNQFRRTILRGGEIVVNLIAEPGHSAIAPSELAGANVSRDVAVIALNSTVDHAYVNYVLKSPGAVEWLTARLNGSVTQKINLGTLRELPVPLPPLNEQRAIAAVLGALDDKIDLNRRMNETLEETARALFKSWFVDFDPVRAKAEGRQPFGMDAATAALFPSGFEGSELGEVPGTWRAEELGAVLARLTDGAHASPPSVPAGMPMASVKDMTQWGLTLESCRHIARGDFEKLAAQGCIPQRGDVLLAKDGATCLDTACAWWDDAEIVLLSSVAILRPLDANATTFLHVWLSLPSTKHYLREGFRSGSAIPRVVLRDLRRARLVFPPAPVLAAFEDRARPLHDKARANVAESRHLATLRDYLLPKLLSGEVRVRDAEKLAEAAAR